MYFVSITIQYICKGNDDHWVLRALDLCLGLFFFSFFRASMLDLMTLLNEVWKTAKPSAFTMVLIFSLRRLAR